jgi:hypothetical protein
MKPTPSKLILFLMLMIMDLLNNEHFQYLKVHITVLVLLEDLNQKQ